MTIDYTAHLRSDGELMARAAARDLDAHVPTCPEWNVAKLVIHTGQHHRWVADAIRKGGEPPDRPPKPGLRGDELIDWFRGGWRDLADLLDDSDDATPAWSWSGDNRVGFWRRRTALETLVHRFDAEHATGEASELDAALSADGVDEVLFVMHGDTDPTYHGPSGRVALVTTDRPGSWIVNLDDGQVPTPTRAPNDRGGPAAGDPEARVGASAADLLLFLWGRFGPEVVEVTGDRSLFDAFVTWNA